ncbi:hypothetical protein KJA15_03515 [Patescibacteria group bacterium]|nr:hypothetical protein [Patescibacteria group bacterium]
MLEKSLAKLEESGIEIGHVETIKKDQLVDTDLFEHEILKKAEKMADFYILYFSLENSVRKLITDVLSERQGPEWWDEKVPDGVKGEVKKRQKQEQETAMSIRSDDPLAYANFGELIDIFNANWSDFSDILRSQKSVQEVLSQFNRIRNVIAHSCELNDDEIIRFKLLIKDWLRIQT